MYIIYNAGRRIEEGLELCNWCFDQLHTHGKLVVKKTDLIFHHITANGTGRVR
jgi:hypothetical protein